MFKTLDSGPTATGPDAARFLSMIVREVIIGHGTNISALAQHRSVLGSIIPHEHYDGVAITLYQTGRQRIRVIRQRKQFWDNLINAAKAIRAHPRIGQFELNSAVRVQFDFFGLVDLNIQFGAFSKVLPARNNFEFGVDGLRIRTPDKDHFFLPGDCYVRSILGFDQLRRYLERLTGSDLPETYPMDRLRSTSFVSFNDQWLPLWRGHPILAEVTIEDLEQVCERSVQNILSNFRQDGRFMYYYDAGRNSHVDHEHPSRNPIKDPYYNELRHCGGIITLLLTYNRKADPKIANVIEQSLDFISTISRTYQTPDGTSARYLVYNRKAKLGGAGLALYALTLSQKVIGISRNETLIHQLANHIISEISDSGEFRYYCVYLDKFVPWEENCKYFSFYYPGEALMGLAAYLKWMKVPSGRFVEIENKVKSALRYLLFRRPHEYASEYYSLPSESWLMMAINELWDLPQFRDIAYADFVFRDADKMISQMYIESNALFPDYVGSFYYNFGDFPYTDGARCEGLVAALDLAEKLQRQVYVKRYLTALIATIRATLLLANTPESLYFAVNPSKALGGIRFKLTRQWFRIDTIQHVVCYYLRFIEIYQRLTEGNSVDLGNVSACAKSEKGDDGCGSDSQGR